MKDENSIDHFNPEFFKSEEQLRPLFYDFKIILAFFKSDETTFPSLFE